MPKEEIEKIPFSQPITEMEWIDIKTGKVIKPNDQQKEN